MFGKQGLRPDQEPARRVVRVVVFFQNILFHVPATVFASRAHVQAVGIVQDVAARVVLDAAVGKGLGTASGQVGQRDTSGRVGAFKRQQVLIGLADLVRIGGAQHLTYRDSRPHQVGDPAHFRDASVVPPIERAGAKHPVPRGMALQPDADLSQVVLAGSPTARFACRVQCGKQHGRQYPDNGYDNQELH